MKKILFIALVAVVCFTNCAKDDPEASPFPATLETTAWRHTYDTNWGAPTDKGYITLTFSNGKMNTTHVIVDASGKMYMTPVSDGLVDYTYDSATGKGTVKRNNETLKLEIIKANTMLYDGKEYIRQNL